MQFFLAIILSYLIGSITWGDIVARIKKIDLRQQGSGNVGATNAFRTMGATAGTLVLLGDALKGVAAVLLGNWLISSPLAVNWGILTGVMAIVGHNWPVFSKFKGGKGVATSLGVVIGLTPLALWICLPTFLVVFLATGYVALGSLLAAISYPVSVYLLYGMSYDLLVFALLVAILVFYRHQKNIKRLLKGEEHRFIYKKKDGASK